MDMAAVRKSRSGYTGALTRVMDKLKLIKFDDVAAITTVNVDDIGRHLNSIERTERNFMQTLDEAQEFVPEGEAEDTFQEEEADVADSFETNVARAKNLAKHLITMKSVQVKLADLTYDMSSLDDTLTRKPDCDYSHWFTHLNTAFSELRDEWRTTNLPNEHPLKGELDTCASRLLDLSTAVASAKLRSNPTSSSSTPTGTSSYSDRTKLPAIDLPTFKGDVLQWPTFWQQFSASVDKRDDLPESTKLSYLRSAIKDPNAQLILNPSMDGPNTYKRLVKELHQRYKRTKKIHRELVEQLINLPAAKNNSRDLRNLVDATTNCMEGLEATGHFTLESFITSMTYSKLPYKLQIDWDDDQADDDKILPLEKKRPAKKQDKKPEPSHNKQRSHVYSVSSPSSSTQTYKWECVLCSPEKHPLHVCSKWIGYSVDQRLKHVKDRHLCSNCLAVGHLTAACKSTYRCRDCGQAHHTSIHQSSPASVQVSSTVSQSQQLPDALLMTAEVLLKGPGGHELKARAFIDPGAGLSLISSRVAQILELPLESSRTSFTTVQGTECQGSKYLTSVTISPLHSKRDILCRPAVVQTVTEKIPSKQLAPVDEYPHLIGLELADPTFNTPGRVDILLGADLWLHLQGKSPPITASASEPGAQDTVFGWTITGPAKAQGLSQQSFPTYHIQPSISNETLYNLAYDFWLAEKEEEPEAPLSLVEAQVEEHYNNHVSYSPSNCRYQVTLPRKPDCQPLGESRPQAIQRYLCNERSIIRRGFHKDFQAQVQGYLDAMHAEKVPSVDISLPNYYLPMHSVTKQSSTSTKLRVVFDGSAASTSGISLNQVLLVGPTIQPTLVNLLLKFRSYPVALTADVAKMYREVELAPADRDLHRFIWRPTPEDPIQDYRMTRVTFGVSASPYLAIRTLQQTARDHGTERPLASSHIMDSFYVDDLLAGAQTEEEAVQLFSTLRSILQRGGFNLCKWRSSSTTVLQSIPHDLQEKLPVIDVTTLQTSSQPKALGLEWNSRQDHMCPSIHVPSFYRKTKRGIISDVSKTFDVLGWIFPAVLPMKILYQQLWEKGQEWDGAAPPEVVEQHSIWREELPCLSTRQLPRCYNTLNKNIISQELHGFADASIKAYGAVVYLRTTYQSHSPTVALVTAKTKVAKKNPPTIPKLELCGALLLTKLLNNVSAVLNIPLEHITAWTDSSIVLAWLDGRPREFKQFVANRVSFILEHTRPQTWKHVPTLDNPADCASRGMKPQELLQHTLWWQGPSWLHQDPVPGHPDENCHH